MARFIGDSDKMQLDNIDDEEVIKNLCIICKVDMGPNNPRQLCRKTYCENEKDIKLCENTDCERYPSDWDSEEDTESTYREGQWKKCCLCDGYFDDDGFGDILFVQEEPNNQEAECNLCGKTKDIVQMKGSGQYLCETACDESEDESDEECEDTEKIANCDLCCKDKSFETYYVFKRGRKQELFSCVKCWENRETQLVEAGSWTWTYHSFPGPAFYTVNKEEEDDKCIFNYYICKYCDYVTTNDDPDCSKCKRVLGMELFQAENPSQALLEKRNKNEPTVCTKDCACDVRCNEDEDMEETTCYLVKPSYKKSVYEELMYTKYYGDTRVYLKVTKIWRYGEFHVDLTDSEAKEIVELNEVNLNKYSTEVICTNYLYDYDADVIDIDKCNKELQEQINLDVFQDVDNVSPYDDAELVDEHDWDLDDTLYSIVGGVELDSIESENENEDESDDENDDESEDKDETSTVYLNVFGGKIAPAGHFMK